MPNSSYTDELLPLNSDCRWCCLDKLVMRLLEYSCSGHDVVLDLHEALCAGQLRCMIRTGRERKLLTTEDWTTTLDIIWWDDADGNWQVDIVIREGGVYLAANAYLWKPDSDRLWPCDLDVPAPDPEPKPKKVVSKKPGPKELKLWSELLVPFLKKKFTRKPYPDRNTSFHAAKDCLFKAGKSMSDGALRNGIKRHFSQWFPNDH